MGQDDSDIDTLSTLGTATSSLPVDVSGTLPLELGPSYPGGLVSSTVSFPDTSGNVPSSTPALDAYNQALGNALGNGQSTSQAIAAAAQAGAKAGMSIAQISQLSGSANTSIAKTPTTAPPSGYQWTYNASGNQWTLTPTTTGQLTSWVSNNIGTVAVGGIGLVAIALLASGPRKGRR
jgi:hypothetical protein